MSQWWRYKKRKTSGDNSSGDRSKKSSKVGSSSSPVAVSAFANFLREKVINTTSNQDDGGTHCLRFFERDGFYSVYGERDAMFIAREYFHTDSVVKRIANGTIETVAVSTAMFRRCISDLLLLKKMPVEVWSPSSSTSSPSTSSSEWKVTRSASTGDLSAFADELEMEHASGDINLLEQTGYSACICTSRGKAQLSCCIGVAILNSRRRTIEIATFEDDHWFGHLSAFLAGMDSANCIISPDSLDMNRLEGVVENSGLTLVRSVAPGVFVKRKKSDVESHVDDAQTIRKLIRPESYGFASLSHFGSGDTKLGDALSVRSAAALIRHMSLDRVSGTWGSYTLRTINVNEHLEVGAGALRALQLFPRDSNRKISGSRSNASAESIFDVLNACSTRIGCRLLRQWFLTPSRNAQVVNQRLDVVQHFVSEPIQRDKHRHLLKATCPDIEQIILRIVRGRGRLNDVLSLYRSTVVAHDILELSKKDVIIVSDSDSDKGDAAETDPDSQGPAALAEILLAIEESLESLKRFRDRVIGAIDVEALKEVGICVLSTTQWPELDRLKACMKELDSDVIRIRNNVATSLGVKAIKQLKLEGHRGEDTAAERKNSRGAWFSWREAQNSPHGIHLRLSKKDERKVRQKLKGKRGQNTGFQILATQGDGVHFTTDSLRLVSVKYCNYAKLFEENQVKIIGALLKETSSFRDGFENLSRCLAELDVLLGFANIAAERGYTRPTVVEDHAGKSADSNIKLVEARHPILDAMDGTMSVVPNDIDFSRDPDGGKVFILTGPNMGGKSTLMKTVGAIAFMAHVGSWVPASFARIPMLDRISMRAGSRDYLAAGCSTFMNEMISISGILSSATPSSLVLVDELGRGTSAWDGLGIAWAVAATLVSKHVSCIFATHFHELKDVPGVQNLHVSAVCNEESGVVMTFRAEPGHSPFSYGIEVARSVGFPEAVVSRASELLKQFEQGRREL